MPNEKHKVVSIPVNCENRTFEKQRRDLLETLEYKGGDDSIDLLTDDWSKRLKRWVDLSWNSWNDEIRRLKQGMFVLLPLNTCGLVGTCDPILLMDQMEHQMKDLRDQIHDNDVISTGVVSDYLKDAYEIGDNGNVYFHVRFDVKDFEPEDINVSMIDDYIKVQAKKVIKMDDSSSYREFCRIIQLPKSINYNQLKCSLTSDGVLNIASPVNAPNYQSLTFNDNGKISVRPKSYNQVQNAHSLKKLEIKGDHGYSIIDNQNGGKNIHVEIPLDEIYEPEDLCISVDSNRIVIFGRHHIKGCHSSSYAEFNNSYEAPETLDPLSISAQLIDKTLVLEAPLMKYHSLKQ
ncbi:unnamed protein product [Schistosoma turkestanicum]|nr:unnamed protein product [Schistosoma turkestanicum]